MTSCYLDSEVDVQTTGDTPSEDRKLVPRTTNEKEKTRQTKRSKRNPGVRGKPVVAPKPVKKGARPSPLPRKRRTSGKVMVIVNRPYISEGDMAQADEMGDIDGRDEGFQDGQEGDNKLRKKTKKKTANTYPDAYSTSPTPMFNLHYSSYSRRRSGFRKSFALRHSYARTKPKPRVQRQRLIPADISTQETTTTPGPDSSDSYFSGEEVEEDVMDISVVKPCNTISGVSPTTTGCVDQVADSNGDMSCDSDASRPLQVCTNKELPYSNMNTDSNGVVLDNHNYNGVGFYRLGSDLSTAAQSSETSEYEQSGSERQLFYLVARGSVEPLHVVMGNTNSNNGNSSKKTNQASSQNNPVPVPKPKPRTVRPTPSSNGVVEKVEKPKIPPKPAVKPQIKRHSSSGDQMCVTAAAAIKRMSSPGTHLSKRFSVVPTSTPSEAVTSSRRASAGVVATNSVSCASVVTPSCVNSSSPNEIPSHYETCESVTNPPDGLRSTVQKQARSSPQLVHHELSQMELKEMFSHVDTNKLRAQKKPPPTVVKPYKSSAGSSGVEDTVASDSDSSSRKDDKLESYVTLISQPGKPLVPKPVPAKRYSLERSHSMESLTQTHLARISRELGKSRSFGPADMQKFELPASSKSKFSFLKTKALSLRKKKGNSGEDVAKSAAKVSPPTTVKNNKMKSLDMPDRPYSPTLSPAMAVKQASLNRGVTTKFTRQSAIKSPTSPRSPKSPRKSPFSSPWDSPSATPKRSKPLPMPTPEPQYETAEGFFRQVTRILKRMTTSTKMDNTKSTGNSLEKQTREPEHIYETAEEVLSARVPTSATSWVKKKLKRSTSAAAKKSLHIERVIRRTPSMDYLDDRMQRTTLETSSSYSSDEDADLDGSFISSLRSSLNTSLISSMNLADKSLPKPHEDATLDVEEPLYQHIRNAEFGFNPPASSIDDNSPLEIARRGTLRLRTKLWSQQTKVVNSGLLGTISREEQKLQEAMFEVIATESSYVRSLDILVNHFMNDAGMNPDLPDGRRVLTRHQYHVIFSNVREVREVAKKFLSMLEKRQHESAIIRNICDIIVDYASNQFGCYVSYCSNQVYQTRQLLECMDNNILFREYIKRLESHDCCQKLQLQSFLLLPMQRITRMPLLILNILNRIPLQHKDRQIVEDALRIIQSVVTDCNDTARAMERTEQLHTIYNQLNFGKMKPFPLVSASRHLVRSGTLCRLTVENHLFGRPKITCRQLFVYMFTDHIIITKPKRSGINNKEMYRVIDHASRKFVHVVPIQYHPNLPYPKGQLEENTDYINMATWTVSTASVQFAFLVSILENSTGSTEHYVFTANSDSERTRWVEAIDPPASNKGEETIYEAWDCPQVQAAFDYDVQQPDELSLERGDVVKVFRKMPDGWYEGERMRDLQWGWFPSNFTVEIDNEHTRARNLRERYRLISKRFNIEELNKIIDQDKEMTNK